MSVAIPKDCLLLDFINSNRNDHKVTMCNIDLETFFISNHSNNKLKRFKPSITQLSLSIKEIEMENFKDRYVQSPSKE